MIKKFITTWKLFWFGTVESNAHCNKVDIEEGIKEGKYCPSTFTKQTVKKELGRLCSEAKETLAHEHKFSRHQNGHVVCLSCGHEEIR